MNTWMIGNDRLLGLGLAALVLALLGLTLAVEHHDASSTVGIAVAEMPEGIAIDAVRPGAPASVAGLQAGDLLFEVNDVPVSRLAEYDQALNSSGGSIATFHVRRDQRELVLEVQPGVPFPAAGYVRTVMLAAAYLGLAALALQRRRRDWRAGLLAVLCFSVAIELSMPDNYFGSQSALYFSLIAYYLLTGVQCAVELHLVSTIPQRARWARRGRRVIPCIYALSLSLAIFFALDPLGMMLRDAPLLPISADLLARGFSVWFLLWACATVAILIVQIRRQQDMRHRNQAILVLMGVSPWAAYAVYLAIADFAGLTYPTWIYLVEDLILFALPLAMLVAIVRYDLLDMERLIRRSLVYGLLTLYLLLGVILLGLGVIPKLGGLDSPTTLWGIALLALALGLSAGKLRQAAELMVERKVFPERHDLRQRLIRLAAEVPERGEASAMATHLATRLAEILEVQWVAVIISGSHTGILPSQSVSNGDQALGRQLASMLRRDGIAAGRLAQARRPQAVKRLRASLPGIGEQLEALGAELLVPLFFRNELIGSVCLSPKRGGELFAGEETELLNLFSHQVAAAFENLKLHQHATYEGLTGLLRREAILDTLNRECERAIRGRRPLVVAMIDLDRFKQVNDRFGHLFGDHVLQVVAETIRQRLRTIDSVGRYGGEEFLIVFPDTNLTGAKVVAEDLRSAVERRIFQPDQGGPVSVSVSIGMAGVDVAAGDPERLALSLVESADTLLYDAKASGRNQVLSSR